ncbi:15387_t:CDS:2 [Entrophospora sp. SA101]|nr:15387_t:CDS:2 [Entrophospora sp. SA101]CAJ0845898.1 13799_t:CDS:2 [Entrophospora sp. SA101]
MVACFVHGDETSYQKTAILKKIKGFKKIMPSTTKKATEEGLFEPFVGIKPALSIINQSVISPFKCCSYVNDVAA